MSFDELCFGCKQPKQIKYTMDYEVYDHDTGLTEKTKLKYCYDCVKQQMELQQLGKEMESLT